MNDGWQGSVDGKWIADFDSSLNMDYYGMPDDRIDYRIIY